MIIFAPYLFLVAAHVVHPAAEPRLNVESSCRAAANLGEADGQSFKACMQDEVEAKNEYSGPSSFPVALDPSCHRQGWAVALTLKRRAELPGRGDLCKTFRTFQPRAHL
jgi:hypothetical protein